MRRNAIVMTEIFGKSWSYRLTHNGMQFSFFFCEAFDVVTTIILDPREWHVIGYSPRRTHVATLYFISVLINWWKKAECHRGACSDPLAREVEILGADQDDRSLGGKIVASKNINRKSSGWGN